MVVDISKQHLKYELCFMYSTKRDKKLLNLTLYKEDKADKVVSIQQAGESKINPICVKYRRADNNIFLHLPYNVDVWHILNMFCSRMSWIWI